MKSDYNDVWRDVNSKKLEVEDMDDESLVEEVAYIRLPSTEIDDIILKFFHKGKLTEEDRSKLVGYYILSYVENFL